ncbi:hypothetical protein [Sphingomonas sp.]|uniref:hypothetical protein n=1 Tax=Sphingomonas sp. TaxID=28214 RepID=UPI0035B27319
MLFSTPTQFAVLALLFVGGWLLGLASHPGGRKWRERYTAERDAHATVRNEHDTRLSAANARIAELERENSRLAHAAPVAPAAPMTGAPISTAPVATRPVAASAARPAFAGERRGWFDWNNNTRR